jgi:U3 small nucleolar RNA-associated protein 10
MPVFTFMGSNVFHRDDNYSFRVVQKVSVLRNDQPYVRVAYFVLDRRRHHPSHGLLAKREAQFSRGPAHSIQRFPTRFYGRNEPCAAPPSHAVCFAFACFLFQLDLCLDRFFIHLVDVLGPDEFLSIVCMLIVAKADKRLVRLQGRDLRAALALPLSLLQHYPSSIQLPVSSNFLPPFSAPNIFILQGSHRDLE